MSEFADIISLTRNSFCPVDLQSHGLVEPAKIFSFHNIGKLFSDISRSSSDILLEEVCTVERRSEFLWNGTRGGIVFDHGFFCRAFTHMRLTRQFHRDWYLNKGKRPSKIREATQVAAALSRSDFGEICYLRGNFALSTGMCIQACGILRDIAPQQVARYTALAKFDDADYELTWYMIAHVLVHEFSHFLYKSKKSPTIDEESKEYIQRYFDLLKSGNNKNLVDDLMLMTGVLGIQPKKYFTSIVNETLEAIPQCFNNESFREEVYSDVLSIKFHYQDILSRIETIDYDDVPGILVRPLVVHEILYRTVIMREIASFWYSHASNNKIKNEDITKALLASIWPQQTLRRNVLSLMYREVIDACIEDKLISQEQESECIRVLNEWRTASAAVSAPGIYKTARELRVAIKEATIDGTNSLKRFSRDDIKGYLRDQMSPFGLPWSTIANLRKFIGTL